MKLYDSAISGNSYKVRLLFAQLSRACEIVPVDILKGESRTAEFLARNPNGRTPVLEDEASCSPLARLRRPGGGPRLRLRHEPDAVRHAGRPRAAGLVKATYESLG
jgi:hypothetical protein